MSLDEVLRDAPTNAAARAAQEEKWKATNIDARQQLHAREAALRYRDQFRDVVHYFWSDATTTTS